MGVPLNLWSAKLGCLKLPQGSVQIVWVKGNRARDCRCSMSRFHLACFEKPYASCVFYECPLLRMLLQGSGACKGCCNNDPHMDTKNQPEHHDCCRNINVPFSCLQYRSACHLQFGPSFRGRVNIITISRSS